jgi:non-specific serine/threonine protein kinase
VILHRLLTGVAPLGGADVASTIERMAPIGREPVRLPWTTPQPVAEPLRAIANRSTSGQVRLRYRNARTFLGALTGWLEATAAEEGGPVTLLLDRLHSVGHLPALPGWRRGSSGSRRSRASAPTRSRAISCPTWRCRSSC